MLTTIQAAATTLGRTVSEVEEAISTLGYLPGPVVSDDLHSQLVDYFAVQPAAPAPSPSTSAGAVTISTQTWRAEL